MSMHNVGPLSPMPIDSNAVIGGGRRRRMMRGSRRMSQSQGQGQGQGQGHGQGRGYMWGQNQTK